MRASIMGMHIIIGEAKQFAVYLVSSGRNGTIYIGMTSNLVGRTWQHKNKVTGGFTARYDVDRLTIVQTAKLNGMNPEAYLRDTLTKIAEGHPISRIGELMPWVQHERGDL
jgi:predicted GIY-YIG superfamily endonuclease